MPAPKPLSADRPLEDPRYDRLGYAPFAKHLAESILNYSPAEGLVVALYGDWGTGKTSALKFIEHYLELQEDAPVVMWFNPWWFAGQEDLIRRFFRQFQSTVVKAKLLTSKSRRDKLAKALTWFGESVSSAPSVPGWPFVSEVGKAAGKGAKAVAEKLSTTDVVALKEQISEALAEQNARVVVILDDIDRLVTDEVRQLFQLIKAVADFPNVTYLLAFDRKVAARAMEEAHGTSGDEYLEKIIQVSFALPPPERAQLQDLFFERLNDILAETPDELFDITLFANLYFEGLDRFIRKPRDIVRLTNALKVTYGAARGEVHAVDFIAIETLRVFTPPAYEIIRMNPGRFTYSEVPSERQERENERVYHDSWLSQLGDHAPSVRAIVSKIFPRWSGIFGNAIYHDAQTKEWRRTLRICSPDVFPTYFRLAPPSAGIAAAEIRQLLDQAPDPKRFALRLSQLASERCSDGNTRASIMLTRLLDHAEKVALELVPGLILALLDAADDILAADTKQRGFLDLGDDYRIEWLLRALVKRLPARDRKGALLAAITHGRALVTMVEQIVSFGRQYGRRGEADSASAERLLPTEQDVVDLETAVTLRIAPMADSGELWNALRPHVLLHAIRHWLSDAAARDVVHKRVGDDEALLNFLDGFKGRRVTRPFYGYSRGQVSIVLDPMKLWGWFDDIELVEQRLTKLDAAKLTNERRTLVTAFLGGLAARRRGEEPKWLESTG